MIYYMYYIVYKSFVNLFFIKIVKIHVYVLQFDGNICRVE